MARTLQPGSRLSHYRIIGPLGAGGMSEVYLAQDETLERKVALKILPPELVRDPERVRRFVLEAKSASSLNHPHIVTIYEVGQDVVLGADGVEDAGLGNEPVHFIAMELVSGRTLKDLVHQEKSDLRSLLGYLSQAAEGLAKAHAAGIVHRDLKPGNIMVSTDGYAKVVDFGLAKLTEGGAPDPEATSAPTEFGDHTGAGVLVGTVGYMSPEQIRGKGVDHRSDIFSFGCILYEVATGRQPFAGDSHIDTMHGILHQKPPPIGQINPKVPAELRRLIRRCLAKSPEQRLQSSKDLALELREIVEDFDSLSLSGTSSSGIAPVVLRRHRRNPVATGVAVVVSLAVLLALVLLLQSRMPGGDKGAPEKTPFDSIRMSILMSPKNLQTAVLSRDGRYLGYIVGPTGQASLRVRQVATGSDVTVLEPQTEVIRGISFSPDGNYLYYLGRDPETPQYSALFEVPSLGGTPRKRLFDVDTAVGFSPDGSQVAFIRGIPQEQRTVVMVANLATGEERLVASVPLPENLSMVTPSWSPDGRLLVGTVQSLEGGVRGDLVSYAVDDGTSRPFGVQGIIAISGMSWLPDGNGLVAVGNLRDAFYPQIRFISYPEGKMQRITNDLDSWSDLSLSADGTSLAAVRRSRKGTLWTIPLQDASAAKEITGDGGENIQDLLTADDGTILYTSQKDQSRNLFAMRPDGSQPRTVTTGSVVVTDPTLLPHGRGVVFAGFGGDELVAHVYQVDLDGGPMTQLTKGGGEVPVDVSPDGKWVLFRRLQEPRKIWRIAVVGGEAEILIDDATGFIGYSRDGSRMAHTFNREVGGRQRIFVRALPAGGGEPVLEFMPPGGAFNYRWLVDGSGLTYSHTIDGVSNIWMQPISGGAPVQMTHLQEGRILRCDWSHDGDLCVFERQLGEEESFWSFRPGASPTKLMDAHGRSIFDFAFTKDQKSIVAIMGDLTSDVVLIRDVTDGSNL